MTPPPARIEAIGHELAILWPDGVEHYIPMERLRALSPSAENMGERDLTGQIYGGTTQKEFPGVTITGWQIVGAYAIAFQFSDGHSTGIYSFDYLREIGGNIAG